MSAITDCPACWFGEHEKHDPKPRGLPGMLGGYVCGCTGDCAERVKVRLKQFGALIDQAAKGESE